MTTYAQLTQQIFDEVGDFNINSTQQLGEIMNNNGIFSPIQTPKGAQAWNEAALPAHNDIGSSCSAGNVDKNCLIFGWEHPAVSLKSIKKGFETVLCPGQICYFDMAYNNATKERGLCWAATIETKQVHKINTL